MTAASVATTIAADATAAPLDSAPRDRPESTGTHELPLGASGQVVIGLEELARVGARSVERKHTDNIDETRYSSESSSDSTFVQVLWPTLAIDWFPVRGFSMGLGSRYAFNRTTDAAVYRSEGADGTTVQENESTGAFHSLVLTPRVGYALDVGSSFGLWARIGLENGVYFQRSSWTNGGTSGASTSTSHLLGAQGSLLATFSPTDYLSVVGGPTLQKYLWQTGGDEAPGDEVIHHPVSVTIGLGAGVRL